jgi:hypothetical protein
MTSLSYDPLNQQPDGGCAEINSRSSRRCSLTSLPTGKAAEWRATIRLAARQVRRRHRILVIRATGAPQIRSPADGRACAGSGQPLPSPWMGEQAGWL